MPAEAAAPSRRDPAGRPPGEASLRPLPLHASTPVGAQRRCAPTPAIVRLFAHPLWFAGAPAKARPWALPVLPQVTLEQPPEQFAVVTTVEFQVQQFVDDYLSSEIGWLGI